MTPMNGDTLTAMQRLTAELGGKPRSISDIQAVRRAGERFRRAGLVRLCDDAIRELRAKDPSKEKA